MAEQQPKRGRGRPKLVERGEPLSVYIGADDLEELLRYIEANEVPSLSFLLRAIIRGFLEEYAITRRPGEAPRRAPTAGRSPAAQ
jgi:hypothetical protein